MDRIIHHQPLSESLPSQSPQFLLRKVNYKLLMINIETFVSAVEEAGQCVRTDTAGSVLITGGLNSLQEIFPGMKLENEVKHFFLIK